MKIDLDKKGLMTLVEGSTPNYKLFEHPLIEPNGRYNGSYGTWTWNSLGSLTEQELFTIYELRRKSFES